jgi:hypothetical protein
MEQFKMNQPDRVQILGRLSLQLLPAILMVTAGLLFIRVFHLSSLTVYRTALGICATLLLALYFIGWQKFKRMYYSYTLTISGNVIMREQANAPTVKLSFIEVNEIAKHPNGSYTIKGKSPDECIEIPNQIDNIHTLERALNEIRPMILKAS